MILTPRNIVAGFLAGALSVIIFHQSAYALMGNYGMVRGMPWRMNSFVPPFGVPDLVNQAFWGGMWGILFALVVDRMPRVPTWVNGLLFAMIFPMLLGSWILVSLIKGRPLFSDYFKDFDLGRLRNGFLLNGIAFGIGLGLIYSYLPSRGPTDSFQGGDSTGPGAIGGYVGLAAGVLIVYGAFAGFVLKGTGSSPLLMLLGLSVLFAGVYQLHKASN